MARWLFTFRPETYDQVKAHGLVGVRARHRERFERISPGDSFVAYVSRVQHLDAIGRITGRPFRDDSDVPTGWGPYEQRAPVFIERDGLAVPGKEPLWGLSMFADGVRTEPSNFISIMGGFVEVTEQDWQMLTAALGVDRVVVGSPDPRRPR